MTDLDDLPFHDWPPAPVIEREPRKCARHRWVASIGGHHPFGERYCNRCGRLQDPARARRGKTSRARGNAYEREVAAKLGGVRKGQYGDQVDVEVPGYLRVQCKNGGTYPRTIDRWLRAIPVEAGLLRAVVLGDAPGPGTRRRSLIVFDLEEWSTWHGGSR